MPCRTRLSEADQKRIAAEYTTRGPGALARELGHTIGTVKTWANRNGYFVPRALWPSLGAITKAKTKSLRLNEHTFASLTEDNAYAFGFLWADGCVHVEKNGICRVILTVQDQDESVLHHVRQVMGSTANLTWRKGVKSSHRENVTLKICSKIMAADLSRLGITPRKSFTNPKYPAVPDELFSTFLRGAIDGDGSCFFSSAQPDKLVIALSGSCNFLAVVAEKLHKILGVRHSPITIEKRSKRLDNGFITYSANADIRKLIRFMYPTGMEYGLPRKKEKMLTWLAKQL